jgi:hypothetical protein
MLQNSNGKASDYVTQNDDCIAPAVSKYNDLQQRSLSRGHPSTSICSGGSYPKVRLVPADFYSQMDL